MLLLIFVNTHAQAETPQPAKINDQCQEGNCENGLYCVQTQSGEQKYAACRQNDLNTYIERGQENCKQKNWTEKTNQEYQNGLAPDGRVLVDVYDQMLDIVKQYKEPELTERASAGMVKMTIIKWH